MLSSQHLAIGHGWPLGRRTINKWSQELNLQLMSNLYVGLAHVGHSKLLVCKWQFLHNLSESRVWDPVSNIFLSITSTGIYRENLQAPRSYWSQHPLSASKLPFPSHVAIESWPILSVPCHPHRDSASSGSTHPRSQNRRVQRVQMVHPVPMALLGHPSPSPG